MTFEANDGIKNIIDNSYAKILDRQEKYGVDLVNNAEFVSKWGQL